MRRAILRFDLQFLAELAKGQGEERTFTVEENAVPDDARVVGGVLNVQGTVLNLILESAELEDVEQFPVLEKPVFGVHR